MTSARVSNSSCRGKNFQHFEHVLASAVVPGALEETIPGCGEMRALQMMRHVHGRSHASISIVRKERPSSRPAVRWNRSRLASVSADSRVVQSENKDVPFDSHVRKPCDSEFLHNRRRIGADVRPFGERRVKVPVLRLQLFNGLRRAGLRASRFVISAASRAGGRFALCFPCFSCGFIGLSCHGRLLVGRLAEETRSVTQGSKLERRTHVAFVSAVRIARAAIKTAPRQALQMISTSNSRSRRRRLAFVAQAGDLKLRTRSAGKS